MIFPDVFIPFSEEIGLVKEIDKFMMHKSMQVCNSWLEKGLDFGVLSLNAANAELDKMSFLSQVQELLEIHNFDASRLEIEILERQSMSNQGQALAVLHGLRALGVSISIDDFGTGYSSLSYLKNLPINTLKIDRSFIKDLPDDKDDKAIVKAIITLAKNLGFVTIAEGAETKEQVAFLTVEGCDKIQGYYYSKPLCASDFEALLRKGFGTLG